VAIITCSGCEKRLSIKDDRQGRVVTCPVCTASTKIPSTRALPKPPTPVSSGRATSTAKGEQFYITHCITEDSLFNAPGYSVRAASTANKDALLLALEYPPYELPIDMWKGKPLKPHTPCRLSYTKHPSGGFWVAHSVFLETDTMGRDRSYFTHLIHLPASTTPAIILRSWDAVGWTREYPPKADKQLPQGQIPTGNAISDEALQTFLSGPETGPTDLAVVVCPDRFRASAAVRRELVRRFLLGVILAIQADGERGRLFVRAEPGLVAMLTYAAVRLLPPAWMVNLTFSTFEPAHRGLRDYKLATVVGTYVGDSTGGLDPELVSSRGYGLDTVRPGLSSSELTEALPIGLDELVDLGAGGEWDRLSAIRRQIGDDTDALGRVGKLVARARAAKAVDRTPAVKLSKVTVPLPSVTPVPGKPSSKGLSGEIKTEPSSLPTPPTLAPTPSLLVPIPPCSIPPRTPPSPLPTIVKPVSIKRVLLVVICVIMLSLFIGISYYFGKIVQPNQGNTNTTTHTEKSDSFDPGDTTMSIDPRSTVVPIDGATPPSAPMTPRPPVVPPTVTLPLTGREAIIDLAKDLTVAEPAKRIKALERIAAHGREANIIGDQLIEAMEDNEPPVRDLAAETLEKVNPEVYPHVFTILRGQHKVDAIQALGNMGNKAEIAVPLLLKCQNKRGEKNTIYYSIAIDIFPIVAMIAPKDKRFAQAVLTYIAIRSDQKRIWPGAAVRAGKASLSPHPRLSGLHQLNVIDADLVEKVKALIAALEDEDLRFHLQVITALQEFGSDAKPALTILKKLKLCSNDAVRKAATEAIKKIE
jgi:hypothetical protein